MQFPVDISEMDELNIYPVVNRPDSFLQTSSPRISWTRHKNNHVCSGYIGATSGVISSACRGALLP